MNDARVAVTVIGADRPGIVAGVTRALYELGCNLEDASSTILSGQFSMMLIVRLPRHADIAQFEHALENTATELGVEVTVSSVSGSGETAPRSTHRITVYGADRPGIVYRVSELLASRGVNITELSSRVVGSADHPVYALMLEVDLADESGVAAQLNELADQLQVDVSLQSTAADVL